MRENSCGESRELETVHQKPYRHMFLSHPSFLPPSLFLYTQAGVWVAESSKRLISTQINAGCHIVCPSSSITCDRVLCLLAQTKLPSSSWAFPYCVLQIRPASWLSVCKCSLTQGRQNIFTDAWLQVPCSILVHNIPPVHDSASQKNVISRIEMNTVSHNIYIFFQYFLLNL